MENSSKELIDSEERFRLLVDGVTDHAIYMLDRNGNVASWNTGAQRLKGYAADEVLGRHYSIFFRQEDIDAGSPVEELRQAVERGRFEQEALRVRKGGAQFWAAIVLTPLLDGAGRLRGFAKVTRDITAQRTLRQAEAEMQSRLILSDRLRSIGTLAAGMAHEINNPLAYVIGNLEVASEKLHKLASAPALPGLRELTDLIADARNGAQRVRNIVSGMKAFAHVDVQRRDRLDVRDALEMALKLTSNPLRHRARLIIQYGPTPDVEAEEGRLVQVFINLLVNAAQSLTGETSDANEIAVTSRTSAAGKAVIEIRDNGRGIPEDTIGRIFEPFFTTRDVGEGTGLGLAICHGIVTGFGGELDVQSQVGKGTVFRVTLPASQGDRSMLDRAPLAPTTERRELAERARVLILDDDPLVGEAMRRMLDGDDVTLLRSAGEALRGISAGERYDVILCDLMMPEMSGMQLHAELERSAPEQAKRIVFVTGGAFTRSAEAFLKRVSNRVLEKPFDAVVLRELVSGAASGRTR